MLGLGREKYGNVVYGGGGGGASAVGGGVLIEKKAMAKHWAEGEADYSILLSIESPPLGASSQSLDPKMAEI